MQLSKITPENPEREPSESSATETLREPSARHSRPYSSRQLIGILFGISAVMVFPALLSTLGGQQTYWLFVISDAFVFGLVAISLDLLMGRSGQISLGHNGFFALGAYAAALISRAWHLDLALTALISGSLTALIGLAFGLPATRLRGHYLGIVTFGFGIAIAQIALAWKNVTGGDEGLSLPPPHLFGLNVASPIAMYYVVFGALAVTCLVVWNIRRTRVGRAWAAIRDNEIAAAAMGIPLVRMKGFAFLLSTFIAGLAGSLYGYLNGFIAPEDFGIQPALLFFAMVVIGGMDSIPGALLGAFLVDAVQMEAATVSGLSLTILGTIIMLVVLFFPSGLKGLFALQKTDRSGDGGTFRAMVRARKP